MQCKDCHKFFFSSNALDRHNKNLNCLSKSQSALHESLNKFLNYTLYDKLTIYSEDNNINSEELSNILKSFGFIVSCNTVIKQFTNQNITLEITSLDVNDIDFESFFKMKSFVQNDLKIKNRTFKRIFIEHLKSHSYSDRRNEEFVEKLFDGTLDIKNLSEFEKFTIKNIVKLLLLFFVVDSNTYCMYFFNTINNQYCYNSSIVLRADLFSQYDWLINNIKRLEANYTQKISDARKEVSDIEKNLLPAYKMSNIGLLFKSYESKEIELEILKLKEKINELLTKQKKIDSSISEDCKLFVNSQRTIFPDQDPDFIMYKSLITKIPHSILNFLKNTAK